MDINQKLTEELNVKRWQIDAAVNLIDEGNTIPFISRYRKEVTGSLNDEQLRKLDERLKYLRNLEEKKEQVIASIDEQGKPEASDPGDHRQRERAGAAGRIHPAAECERAAGADGGAVHF